MHALTSGGRWCLLALVTLWAGCFPQDTTQVSRQRVTMDTHDSHFPISTGPHSGNSCETCHGKYDTFTQFTCISCHAHDIPTTDTAHRFVIGYTYAPNTCLACHPTGTAETREEHSVSNFPIVAGNHAAVSCTECHAPRPPAYACGSCHAHQCDTVAPLHHSVTSGFVCESRACRNCHPNGETVLSRAVHTEEYFPIATGNHKVACSSCHEGTEFTVFNCTSCHAHTCDAVNATHQGTVANYNQCQSPACLECHPGG